MHALLILHMLRAKRGFAQSWDCHAQTLTLDPWFVCAISRLPLYIFNQSTRVSRNVQLLRRHKSCIDYTEPGIAIERTHR